jgi:phospholipid N-methyltransferase
MQSSEEMYNKLSQKYTDEEIVEGFVFNETLSEEEQREVDSEFRTLRLQQLKNRTPEQQLRSHLMQMQIRIKHSLNSQ